MIGHLKRHYKKLQYRHKAILAGVFILGSMVSLFSSLFANTLLPFEQQLDTMFAPMGFDSGNVSEVHFNQGGNNYAGLIFWLTPLTLSTPQQISVDGDPDPILCSTQLRGLYYNNMRGWRLWPLDASGFDILQTYGTGYGAMTFTGGFYTDCTGTSIVYQPQDNEVYGYIQHTRSGVTMEMVAGVNYSFSTNEMDNGGGFSGSLRIATGGVFSGRLRDNYGGIAELGSGQGGAFCGNAVVETGEICDGQTGCALDCTREEAGLCGGFSVNPTIINTGGTITFTCTGQLLSGYTITGYKLTILSGSNVFYSGYNRTGALTSTWTTGASLPLGTYTAACLVLHGTGIGPVCPGSQTIHVVASGSCNSNFVGNVIPGAIFASGVNYFSATTGIYLDISATESVDYLITGNFTGTPLNGSYTGTTVHQHIYLSGLNTRNIIYSTFSTGICAYNEGTRGIYVDTQAPTQTTLVTPASGAILCSSGSTNLSWTASTDSGAGLSGYRYTLVHASGTVYSATTASGVTGATIQTSGMLLGNYTRTVQAIDGIGNISTSATGFFSINPTVCSTGTYGTGIQIIGSLSSILNADLDTVYSSEIFYIRGLTGSTLISVAPGTLIVNGTGIGTTGMITSTTPLRIELVSSDQYDDMVTSTISVAGLTGTFSVTTKDNSCNLTRTQELTISRVYGLLKDQYDDNTTLLNDFMATFQSILGDEVDVSEDCSLQYLLELINNDYDNADVDTSNHIAPNCKEYQISYDNREEAYYSPMMRNRYYFINRETLIRHIDFYNAGDCHINTYGNISWSDNRNTETIHVAPNGKIYHIQSAGGGYTSPDFVGSKYFDAMSTITSYIDSKNPATNVWIHTVDRTFSPITYLAPNSKEYRIYKTSKGYMSYKLMKVIYFNTLAELQSYINRNNPVRR